MSKRKADILAGLVSIVVAIIFMVQGLELTGRSNALPQVLEIFLIITGLYLVFKGIKTNAAEKVEGDTEVNWVKATVIVLGTFVYVACVIYIGFYVSTFVYLIFGSWYLNEKGLTTSALGVSVLFSAIVSGVLYLTFTVFLLVPTPSGLFF